MVWSLPLLNNFPQFLVIHTVKGLDIAKEVEVDFFFFLEFSCSFYDPMNAGNFISGCSDFSKSTMYIWKFLVHTLLKPSFKDFEPYLASK